MPEIETYFFRDWQNTITLLRAGGMITVTVTSLQGVYYRKSIIK